MLRLKKRDWQPLQDPRSGRGGRCDEMTGLPGRMAFRERLVAALHRDIPEDHGVLVLHLDLDRFKQFNETLGHGYGDNILREVARRLRAALREGDTVARLGGDEFAVMLENVGADVCAGRIATKLLEAIAQPLTIGQRELFLTASIGVAYSGTDGKDADELLRCSEIAMHRSKEQGRNTFSFYDPCMHSRAGERLQLESELHHALVRNEFRLYYQPQVAAESGAVTGFEALLRWQHPQRGIVPPNEFIPLLEDTRLIVPVGEWVLRTACSDTMALEAAGYGALRVSVNISAHQFKCEGFVAMVTDALVTSGLPASRLDLEITETLLMDSTPILAETMRALNELGVRISVDDFGTGYSSLAYLKRFPVQALKIDRSFISGIPGDRDDVAIATAILVLAEQLGLEVIAEAVESAEQCRFLQAWAGVQIQGFYFAPPLPIEQLKEHLDTRPRG